MTNRGGEGGRERCKKSDQIKLLWKLCAVKEGSSGDFSLHFVFFSSTLEKRIGFKVMKQFVALIVRNLCLRVACREGQRRSSKVWYDTNGKAKIRRKDRRNELSETERTTEIEGEREREWDTQ